MKKILVLFSVLLMVGVSSIAGAVTINFNSVIDNGGYSSPVAGATIETFDGNLLWTWNGSYQIVSGSVTNQYAAPAYQDASNITQRDETGYVVVPKQADNPGGSATVQLGASYNYLGLWWGSMDTYNTLELYNGTTLVGTISGSNVLANAASSGDQLSPDSNRYVNIFTDTYFNSFKMTSTQKAFEVDNIAVANVPEPTTMLLLGLGVLGLAGIKRKFEL